VIVISVNAATNPEPLMDASDKQPSLAETVGAMNDVQLRRYSAATLDAIRQGMAQWAQTASTPQRPVSTHFIQVTFADLSDTGQRKFFQALPTSFSLDDEEVDKLISVGGSLLRENAQFQGLLTELNAR
jgi:NTE family protein